MTVPPLHQLIPRWNEVLTPFRERDYARALAAARDFLSGLAPGEREKLVPYHYANIHNNIAESAYRVLVQVAEESVQKATWLDEWGEFFHSLEDYVQNAETSVRKQTADDWLEDTRFPKTLLSHALDLLLRFQPDELAVEGERWVARFMAVWGAELALDVLLNSFNAERINVLRQGYIANTRTLAEIYLRLTENLPSDAYRHPRSLVMDILSDLTYFTGGDMAEEEALRWVEQALAVNPKDRFAQQRRKDILDRKIVMEQTRRFNHDANTAIAGLISNLSSLERLPLADPALRIVEKMRLGLNRIHAVHRLVQRQQAQFKDIDARQEVDRLIAAYDQARIEVTGGEEGEKLETDLDYFLIVLETLIRNALEAFERRRIPIPDRRIHIVLNPLGRFVVFRDNAGGIDPQLKDRIFDLYVSSKAVKQTTGLGLSTARKIMELLEGHIDLTDPQPSGGAEFVIQF